MDKKECKRSVKSENIAVNLHPATISNQDVHVDLASFPELNPNPIVEADMFQHIHYMNPAARRLFPEMVNSSHGHPFLQHLESFYASVNDNGLRTCNKEVRIGERYYQENMHYIENCGHIRIYGLDITEKKEAELIHLQLKREMDAVFNAVMTPLFIVDVHSKVIRSNPAAVAFYGIDIKGMKTPSTADILSIRHADGRMVTPEQLPSFRALRGERVENERFMVTHPEGREIIIEGSASPIYDGVRISGAAVVLHDVTEREKLLVNYEKEITVRRRIAAELLNARDELEDRVRQRTAELEDLNNTLIEKVLEVEEARKAIADQSILLESFFENSLMPLVFLDRNFNFLKVNKAYADACQRDISEFSGRNHFELYPNKENESIFRSVVSDKKPYVASAKPFSFPDHPEWGTTYWDWILSPVLDDKRQVLFLVFFLKDVTENRKQRLLLEEREKLLQIILESLPVGVWIHDENGRIKYVNQAGKDIWGSARYVGLDQFDECKAWWLKTGTKIETDEWAAIRAVKKGETTLGEEIHIQCFDGTTKILLTSAIPIRDEEGLLAGAITVNQDITERKKAELMMLESREHLRALSSELVLAEERERKRISMLLHDRIAQMLAAAKLKLTLIRKEQTPGAYDEIISEIQELINQSLQETRTLMTEISPPIFYELGFVAAVEWLTENITKEYDVEISFSHEGIFDGLQHDMAVLLFQTIREFLVNAGKHSLAKQVMVSISTKQGEIEIQVTDDGIGFDVSNIGKPTSEGGFGLFGVKERMKSYGGKLEIISGKGKGTKICLKVPVLSKRKRGRKTT